jgi:hypothetical protein
MANGGFRGPSGRCDHSVERALSASAILPTVAFAALGTVTVLLVAQMGMLPVGAVVGPSARDGGHSVTVPRMSVTFAAPVAHRLTSAPGRKSSAGGHPTLTIALPVAHLLQPARGRAATNAGTRSTVPVRAVTTAVVTTAVTPAAVTTAVTPAAVTTAVTPAAVTPTVTTAAVTPAVTTAAVKPRVQADSGVTVALDVLPTFLTPAAVTPGPRPADQKSQNEDKPRRSARTSNHFDAASASRQTDPASASRQTDPASAFEHAKAGRSGS